MLGVSRQRASELARSATFPPAVAELKAGPVFVRPAVERFVEGWSRRPGRPARDDLVGPAEIAARFGLTPPELPGRKSLRGEMRVARRDGTEIYAPPFGGVHRNPPGGAPAQLKSVLHRRFTRCPNSARNSRGVRYRAMGA